ncbi:carbohydrate ABC transporter permease [Humibacter antri]
MTTTTEIAASGSGVPAAAEGSPRRKAQRLVTRKATWYFFALLICVVMILPLLWMLSIALKGKSAVFDVPPTLVPTQFHWENFINGPAEINFPTLLLNSVIITALSVIGSVATSMMAGYALARLRFPGRKTWFYLFVGSMLLPPVIGIIPLFTMFRAIGWYDTWLPLIVPSFLGGNALFIFLARQYFLAIPYSIDEAAKVDGAGYFTIFVRIMLPMTKPVWITMAILAFQYSWNDYLNPLIYLYTSGKWPLSVGMASFVSAFAGQTPNWSAYMATNILYMLPPLLVFFVAQRYFVRGLSALGTTTQK